MEQDVDAAIELAAERALQAEEQLLQKLGASPDLEGEAREVEHRAEDLHELAADAAANASFDGEEG